MIRKNITYTNFENETVTEEFFFNLTKAELVEMEINHGGGFKEYLEKIEASQDVKEIYGIFKEIVLSTYGEKTPDGKRFIKSKEISEAFAQTEAYSELLFELMEADKAAEFINALMPKDLAEKLKQNPRAASEALMQGHKKAQEKDIKQVPDLPAAEPVLESTPKVLTDKELKELSHDQLIAHLRGAGGQPFLQ